MSKREKRVPAYQLAEQEKSRKIPRLNVKTTSNDEKPSWVLSGLDIVGVNEQGKWGWNGLPKQTIWELHEKLKSFESMTWAEIEKDKKHHHSVELNQLTSEAQKRLVELRLDDIDALFRFGLSNLERIWGIRDGSTFRVLWWDPMHQVCPSKLLHT